MNVLTVDVAEQGMKLIRFLARRLGADDDGMLHRWIRTGQVRLNGGRARPFVRLAAGDAVRVPPFAVSPDIRPEPGGAFAPYAGQDLGGALRVLAVTGDMLVLDKPAGLPAQPGSGHADSVVHRLRELFAGRPYVPAPAHRLDKDCSGILLAGLHHEAQRHLHALFAEKSGAESAGTDGGRNLEKFYLAWVRGLWPHKGPYALRDRLAKVPDGPAPSFERVRAVAGDEGRPALAEAEMRGEPLRTATGPASLLRIRLHTGRTHQIRAQLAERGHPIIGDVKYGGGAFPFLLLHAHRLVLSGDGGGIPPLDVASWPEHWPAPFRIAAPDRVG